MKRNELVKRIAELSGLPKAECGMVLDTFQRVVTEALVSGDKVILRGFLTFETTDYREREGYDPNTGEVVKYKPVKAVRCKIGKPIKTAVNGG